MTEIKRETNDVYLGQLKEFLPGSNVFIQGIFDDYHPIVQDYLSNSGKMHEKIIRINCTAYRSPFYIFNEIARNLKKPLIFSENRFKKAFLILLMHTEDQILLKHACLREDELDKDTLASMIWAVQKFFEEGLGKLREGSEEKPISYHKIVKSNTVVFLRGNIMVVVFLTGDESPLLESRLEDTANFLYTKYGDKVEEWKENLNKIPPSVEARLKQFLDETAGFGATKDSLIKTEEEILKELDPCLKDTIIFLENANNLDVYTLATIYDWIRNKKCSAKFVIASDLSANVWGQQRTVLKEIRKLASPEAKRDCNLIQIPYDKAHYNKISTYRRSISKLAEDAERQESTREAVDSLKAAIKEAREAELSFREELYLYDKLFDAALIIGDSSTLKKYAEQLEKKTTVKLDFKEIKIQLDRAVRGSSGEGDVEEIELLKVLSILKQYKAICYYHRAKGESEIAYEEGEKAIEIGKKLISKDPEVLSDLGRLYYILPWILVELGRYKEAIDMAEEGKALLEEKGSGKDLADMNYITGKILYEIEEYEKAIPYVKTAIKFAEGDKNTKAKFMTHMPSNYNRQGDRLFHSGDENGAKEKYLKAMKWGEEGRRLAKSLKNEYLLSYFYIDLADSAAKLGNLDLARRYAAKAKKLASGRGVGVRWIIIYACSVEGIVKSKENDLKGMKKSFKEGLETLGNADASMQADLSFEYGYELFRHPETRKKAEKYFELAQKLIELTKEKPKSWKYDACEKYLKILKSEAAK